MASGVLFLLGDIIGGYITPNYSYISNAVSELSQRGAIHRPIISIFLTSHAVMSFLFGMALVTRHRQIALRTSGIMFLMIGACNALTGSIWAQDPIGSEATFGGTMHLVLVAVTVLNTLIMMPLLAHGMVKHYGDDWRRFRFLTWFVLPVMTLGGVCTPMVISKGIPIMGLLERIVSYSFLVCFMPYQSMIQGWEGLLSLGLLIGTVKRE